MSGLDWLPPANWPLVLLLPILAVWLIADERRWLVRQERWLGRRTVALLGRPVAPRWRGALWCLAAICLGLALLQPLAGRAPGQPAQPDVVLCLDLSRSMSARDVRPDRLGAAMADIAAFAAAAPGARAGLVGFAGSAELVAPLTADLHAVARLAASLDPSRPLRGGTDLGPAVDTALAALRRAGAAAPAIVLLTDGEDFGAGAAAAVERARAAGVAVACVAYGSESGSKIVVPGDDGEVYLRDERGEEVVTAPDRAGLAALAALGGGRLVVGDGAGALVRLHEQVLLPHARRAAHRDPTREPPHVFQWPLLAGIVLVMLVLALPERRR